MKGLFDDIPENKTDTICDYIDSVDSRLLSMMTACDNEMKKRKKSGLIMVELPVK